MFAPARRHHVLNLWLLGVPSLFTSGAVMQLAGAPPALMIVQVGAAMAALAIAWGSRPLWQRVSATGVITICLLATVACASPLVGHGDGPQRWWHLGGVTLYVASIVVPTCLVLCGRTPPDPARPLIASAAALVPLALVLALQPDLSQVLAITAAVAMILWQHDAPRPLAFGVSASLLGAIGLARQTPDPYLPVPYVEGVLFTAWHHSLVVAGAVVASAVVLIGGLARHRTLRPAAAYLAVLSVCAIAGITPAPLVGYGSGPWLGFGLFVGAALE